MIPRLLPIRQHNHTLCRFAKGYGRRTLVAPPKPGTGPFMTRRSDRALPSLEGSNRWLRTLPLFLTIIVGSCAAIFNYQKSSSSVVNSNLYALRTNPEAREMLGDEIYFASKVPWIRGELNQLHGRIDIKFWVKGTKRQAFMRFHSERRTRMGYVGVIFGLSLAYFETLEWSLTFEDGTVLHLMKPESSADPLQQALPTVKTPEATA
ncbi:MAG: hypothetical protein M1820_006533 [Bogoriella megaspora]|nr:MAG: hypothetical protein M1820_006533 [Bogoriella megaspora]